MQNHGQNIYERSSNHCHLVIWWQESDFQTSFLIHPAPTKPNQNRARKCLYPFFLSSGFGRSLETITTFFIHSTTFLYIPPSESCQAPMMPVLRSLFFLLFIWMTSHIDQQSKLSFVNTFFFSFFKFHDWWLLCRHLLSEWNICSEWLPCWFILLGRFFQRHPLRVWSLLPSQYQCGQRYHLSSGLILCHPGHHGHLHRWLLLPCWIHCSQRVWSDTLLSSWHQCGQWNPL